MGANIVIFIHLYAKKSEIYFFSSNKNRTLAPLFRSILKNEP